ncbi:hypothetical protein AVEN_73285-1 [Araneus ventricosus]|uniref:Uncharacterized protein n=1 Tax=Araneus ventricosus TaxID=182803 RepID=A0A4Y2KKX6_ARAVE|nr:hypothetical protein AVEN_73285-1 [Araneus ventricosus]
MVRKGVEKEKELVESPPPPFHPNGRRHNDEGGAFSSWKTLSVGSSTPFWLMTPSGNRHRPLPTPPQIPRDSGSLFSEECREGATGIERRSVNPGVDDRKRLPASYLYTTCGTSYRVIPTRTSPPSSTDSNRWSVITSSTG